MLLNHLIRAENLYLWRREERGLVICTNEAREGRQECGSLAGSECYNHLFHIYVCIIFIIFL